MSKHARHRAAYIRPPITWLVAVFGLVVLAVILHVESGRGGSSVAQLQVITPVTTGASEASANTPAPTSSAASSVAVPRQVPGVGATSVAPPAALAKTVPVHLTIASIGVSTALQPLGLLPDGTMEPPSQWGVAGWYADGVYPGQLGPAVIAGHIDSINGPAVFYRLHDLTPGARVLVTEKNGSVLTFVVDSLQSFPKNQFPSKAVYGPSPYPVLRLITCTGDFDWATHNYLDNLVVSAHLA